MLLGSWWVPSTHAPLIVRWSFKVWYLWHRQCTHKHTLKHQGFIKIQETPQRPFADQMDEPAPCFFLTVGWMGYQLLWASLATLVSGAGCVGSWKLGSSQHEKNRRFTLLFFLSRVWESMKCAMQIWLIWVVFGQTWCLDVFFHRYAFFQQIYNCLVV